MRNSSYSIHPGPNKHLASYTAQPGSLPRILQQTLLLVQGFSLPGPRTGPRYLIVLKHSSYRLIFQCPLSLVSDLHICWNTVGCSLCFSDQLGVSLVLKGSGLRSHLSCRHLIFPTLNEIPFIQSRRVWWFHPKILSWSREMLRNIAVIMGNSSKRGKCGPAPTWKGQWGARFSGQDPPPCCT